MAMDCQGCETEVQRRGSNEASFYIRCLFHVHLFCAQFTHILQDSDPIFIEISSMYERIEAKVRLRRVQKLLMKICQCHALSPKKIFTYDEPCR